MTDCAANTIICILLTLIGLMALGALIWYAVYTPIRTQQRTHNLQQLGRFLLHQKPIDLERYGGEWYEIARLPNSFQSDCLRSKATYSRSASQFDEIVVLNECATKDGPIKRVVGRARPFNAEATALSVSFAPRWLGSGADGDYWILDIDDDYQYVLVGSPDRKYLWLLARRPNIEPAQFERMRSIAESKGYDTEKLIVPPLATLTSQTNLVASNV